MEHINWCVTQSKSNPPSCYYYILLFPNNNNNNNNITNTNITNNTNNNNNNSLFDCGPHPALGPFRILFATPISVSVIFELLLTLSNSLDRVCLLFMKKGGLWELEQCCSGIQ